LAARSRWSAAISFCATLIIRSSKILDSGDYAFGQTREYGDLAKQGVIDPAKVVRTALQDAASVAGLLVTNAAGGGKAEAESTADAAWCGHGRHRLLTRGSTHATEKAASERRPVFSG
jgi:hypothetical protein